MCRSNWGSEEVHSAISQQHSRKCETIWAIGNSSCPWLSCYATLWVCVFLSVTPLPHWTDAPRLLLHVLFLHVFDWKGTKKAETVSQMNISQIFLDKEIISALIAHTGMRKSNPQFIHCEYQRTSHVNKYIRFASVSSVCCLFCLYLCNIMHLTACDGQ